MAYRRTSRVARSRSRSRLTRYGVSGSTRQIVPRGVSEMPAYHKTRVGAGALHPTKFQDVNVAAYAMNTTGTIALLPATVQIGSTINDFTGNRFVFSGLQARGNVKVGTTTTIAAGALLIVYDKSPRAALPTITEILDTADSQSFQKISNRDRFEILYRKDFSLSGTTAAVTSDSMEIVNMNMSFNRVASMLTGNQYSVGTIVTGALYVVTVGDTVAGNADLEATLGFRVFFWDD